MFQSLTSASPASDFLPTDFTRDIASGMTLRWRIGGRKIGSSDWAISQCCGNSKWTETGDNGAAVRVAVAMNDDPYVVNSWNELFSYSVSGKKWTKYPGRANDVGVGMDGSVWIVTDTPVGDGNYRIHQWDASQSRWIEHPSGKGVRIAVDKLGNPWLVQADGKVVQYSRF
jgi:hypothetical protein